MPLVNYRLPSLHLGDNTTCHVLVACRVMFFMQCRVILLFFRLLFWNMFKIDLNQKISLAEFPVDLYY